MLGDFPRLLFLEDGSHVHLPTHAIQLTSEQQAKINVFLKSLAQNPHAPPSEFIPEPDLLNLLIEQRRIVQVSDSVIFSVSTNPSFLASSG